jgi:TonB family protein
MRFLYGSVMLVAATACLTVIIEHAPAESAQSSDPRQGGAMLIKLTDSTYPPLARQAKITGDVELILRIRRDGSVESAVVVSGHPMLNQAALDSARQSRFECKGCSDAANPYALKYKFQIVARDPPKDCNAPTEEKRPPVEVDLSRHQVTVSAWGMWTCDPAVLRVRSAKCLYLWRCGTREEH